MKSDKELAEKIYQDDNSFVKEQSNPNSITLNDFIIGAGSAFKDYCQVTNIKDALLNIANISYNDLDKILERLLFLKVIERGEVNNEHDGCYKVWSFTEEALQLYLDMKFKQVNIKNT